MESGQVKCCQESIAIQGCEVQHLVSDGNPNLWRQTICLKDAKWQVLDREIAFFWY